MGRCGLTVSRLTSLIPANALAWATGHIALPRILKAGLALDIIGVPLLIGVIWTIAMVA